MKTAGNLEIVPPKEGNYLGIAFSPDGNSIYYGYAATTDNNGDEVFKVPVLGAGAAPVKANPEEGPPALSHDGKRIAFLRHSREHQSDTLVIAKADGSDEQPLMNVKWPDRLSWDWGTSPAWTGDDQNIALPWIRSDADGYYLSILEMHLPDRARRTISLSPQRFEQPTQVSLLSDASGIIMSARAQGGSFVQLWHLGRDGSVRALTNDLSDYNRAILTADSSAFVTVQKQTLSNIWVAPKGETAQATQITSGLGRYFDLSWTPDGKILYASDASGSADIFEQSADGSGVRQLTSGQKRNFAPAVSPDNRLIAFHSNRSGVFQIWRMERDGGNPIQLTKGKSESHWPQFLTDGKWVIYEHFESGVSATVWKVPIEGGTPVKAMEGFAMRPVISPDGKWFGYWQNDGQENSHWRLAVMSLETGKQVRTFEVPQSTRISWDTPLHWSADSRSLTYVHSRAGVDNLWAQSVEGGAPKQLTNFSDMNIFAFDWTRDGKLVASRGVITSDVVLMSDAGR